LFDRTLINSKKKSFTDIISQALTIMEADLARFVKENKLLKERLVKLEKDCAQVPILKKSVSELTAAKEEQRSRIQQLHRKIRKTKKRRQDELGNDAPSVKKTKLIPVSTCAVVDKLGNYFVIPRSHFSIGHKKFVPHNAIWRLAHCQRNNKKYGYDTQAAFGEYFNPDDVATYARTILFEVFWTGTGMVGGNPPATAESMYDLVSAGYVKKVTEAIRHIHRRKSIHTSTKQFMNTLIETTRGKNTKKKEGEENEEEEEEEQTEPSLALAAQSALEEEEEEEQTETSLALAAQSALEEEEQTEPSVALAAQSALEEEEEEEQTEPSVTLAAQSALEEEEEEEQTEPSVALAAQSALPDHEITTVAIPVSTIDIAGSSSSG